MWSTGSTAAAASSRPVLWRPLRCRETPISNSSFQPQSKEFRQARRQDLSLRCSNIVFGAAQRDQAGIRLIDSVGSAWIAVAWLSHRTGIDQITGAGLQLETFGVSLRIHTSQASHAVPMTEESTLQMCMPEERDGGIEIGRNLGYILFRDHIFVLVQRGAVHDLKAIDSLGTFGEIVQICDVIRFHDLVGPHRRSTGD